MLVLSLVFVAAMPVMSFAFEPVNEHVRIEKERTLPDGTRVKETTTVIKPSKSGAKAGAAAGAAAGATIGSFVPVIGTGVGAAVGAIAGGIAGWIYGQAD
ncbi:MAG: hypothetical protein IJ667_12000 [Synergistaceae bacterium]|nr:hypothetical protein [Synergistaceae bacterium]